jgi:uncharacterized protein (TIGR03067 family)
MSLLAASVVLSAQTSGKGDPKQLQGTWAVLTFSGQELPTGVHSGLVISGDKYQGLQDGTRNEAGTIKIDGSKDPMPVDLVIVEGTDAGKTQLALASVDSDVMTLVLGDPGDPTRPKSITTNLTNTLTLARIKPMPAEMQGVWEGTAATGTDSVRMTAKLSNGADGLAAATFGSVDQGNADRPVAAVIVRGTKLRLVMPVVRATYDAELKDGQLVGTLVQGNVRVPLTLRKK